jgi:hypothetical protein
MYSGGDIYMSAGKIVLLVLGIIILLISLGLMAIGGTSLWANARYVDNAGFLTSDTLNIQRDSHAVVAGPIEVDNVALRVLRAMGIITVFEFEGQNNNSSKQIFMGVTDQAELENYLNNVAYDEITSFDFGWRPNLDDVRYINHPGSSLPSSPTSESIWTESVVGNGVQTLVWETEEGRHSIVMMNSDGSRGVDLDVIFKTKIPSIVGWGVGFLVGGIVLLIIGGLMIFFAVRR